MTISGQTGASILLSYMKQNKMLIWVIYVYIPLPVAQIALWALLLACLRVRTPRTELPEIGQPSNAPQEA